MSQSKLFAAAAAGIALGLTGAASAEASMGEGAKGDVKCFGINEKAKNSCAVSPKQIRVANKVYNDKFAKSKPLSCHGTAKASPEEGQLAWVETKSQEECFKKDGFVFEKGEKGKLAVVDKKGKHGG